MLKTITLLLSLTIAPAFAEPFSVRVSVSVDADATFQAQLTSCINRELRAIPGVVVNENNASVAVDVIALELTRGTEKLGFGLSLMIHQPTSKPWLAIVIATDIPTLCKSVAADIEQDSIEPAIEAWQGRQDLTPSSFMATQK